MKTTLHSQRNAVKTLAVILTLPLYAGAQTLQMGHPTTPLTPPQITAFGSSLEGSTDGSNFGTQVTANAAPAFATSAPDQSANVNVILRWQPVILPIGSDTIPRVTGYIVLRANHAVWDSVAFVPGSSTRVSANVSPESNALFRIAPVYQVSGSIITKKGFSDAGRVPVIRRWTADTSATLRVITH